MPIYAFECDQCGHAFDRLQKLSDADPKACPACGHGVVRRQVTAPSFRLAGAGWYETDFKSDKDKRRNLAGDSTPAGGATAAPAATPAAAPAAASKPAPAAAKP